ncbi:hypothetical protein WSK_2545 [Novosphingobium sp. Rr 2-17]|uniref:autotransporter outer membrane beta-barrel domain-containing protein n=1 Tax=Novosphingobium sp. Rr 2-17 TaxID=555793 RepID=UPI0002697EC5|nr:autotransporter outer membrane beta-barrel domain-containing protein [Novosphingobium sp. Rr 2-17]EIZ79000.1 hypothetical protein WSK_2545 [Novosphingobium sp. Rr 2-17]
MRMPARLAAALLSSPILMCAVAVPIAAQEADSPTATLTVAAPPVATTTGPTAQDTQESPWSLTASGGVSARADGPDGSWQSLAVTRNVDRGYVRASLMRYHGTLVQSDVALPSNYYIGTVSAGGNFSGWVLDGWGSYGKQVYGDISSSTGSRKSNGAKSSDYYALGGDFGRVVSLGGSWYLTPTVAGSYAYGKLLRPQPTGTDVGDMETSEPTWSASAGLRLDYAFGQSRQNYIGLTASHNWTSNGVSNVRVISDVDDTALRIDSYHKADRWTELGATGSMKITPRLRVDVVAARGFGVASGDYTNVGLSLRRSF